MPNLTTVTVTAGVPTSGSGTVSTLDAVLAVLPAALAANGGLKVEGVSSGVAVPISSAALTNINTALGSTALDLGASTGGSRTLRVAIDTSQTEGSQYLPAAVSTTTVLHGGGAGAAGDYLSHVIVSPATAGCGVVTVLDNATAVASFPGGGTTALSNLIPFVIPIGITSTSGAWKITTGANVTCTGVGRFT